MRLFESPCNTKILFTCTVALLAWLFVCIAWITFSSDAQIMQNICYAPGKLFGAQFSHVTRKSNLAGLTFITSISPVNSITMLP